MELNDDIIQQASKIVQDKARTDGKPPVCIAVFDRAGIQSYYIRMLNTVKLAIPLSVEKARTSALMGVTTKQIHERLINEQLSIADFCGSATTGLVGGVPIIYKGEVIGGVGVSGRKPVDDEQLAYLFAEEYIKHLD